MDEIFTVAVQTSTNPIDHPAGICIDSQNNIYVADTFNYCVRRMDTKGCASVAIKSAPIMTPSPFYWHQRYNYPKDVKVDQNSSILVLNKNTIQRINPITQEISFVAGREGEQGHKDGQLIEALFNGPAAFCVDKNNDIYVADSGNHCIRKILLEEDKVITVAGVPGIRGWEDGQPTSSLFSDPSGIAVDMEGTIWVSDKSNHVIRKITEDSVETVAGRPRKYGLVDGQGNWARFCYPRHLVLAPDKCLKIADCLNHCIRSMSPDGTVTTIIGTGKPGDVDGFASAMLNTPYGMAIDNKGVIYVTEYEAHRIRKIVTTLWSTQSHNRFRGDIKKNIKCVMMMAKAQRSETVWALLPNEILFLIFQYVGTKWQPCGMEGTSKRRKLMK